MSPALSRLLVFVLVPSVLCSHTQTHLSLRQLVALNPYPTKPRLTFRPDGSFKLTVFSDLHFGENPWEAWGPEQDFNSTRLMRRVLADEQPDFVVLNGDQITGENTFRENSTSLVDQVIGPLKEANVPFASCHGNHDNQANITHLEEILREQASSPLSYTRASFGVGGDGGPGNYWVPIYAKKHDSRPALVLWFFDSRGGVFPGNNSTRVPDWVDSSIAVWIKEQTGAMNRVWGPPDNRGALAFVHIPPAVVQAVQKTVEAKKNPGLNDDLLQGDGSVQATSQPGDEGRDTAFWDALNGHVHNLHALISGHDHGNEWCAREKEKDVVFCFAKHSGYGGYDSSGWGHGVRNLLFTSTNPRAGVRTWIRLENGEKHADVVLDNTYGR